MDLGSITRKRNTLFPRPQSLVPNTQHIGGRMPCIRDHAHPTPHPILGFVYTKERIVVGT